MGLVQWGWNKGKRLATAGAFLLLLSPAPTASADSDCAQSIAQEFTQARVLDSTGYLLNGKLELKHDRLWFYPNMDEPILLGRGSPLVWETGVGYTPGLFKLSLVTLSHR